MTLPISNPFGRQMESFPHVPPRSVQGEMAGQLEALLQSQGANIHISDADVKNALSSPDVAADFQQWPQAGRHFIPSGDVIREQELAPFRIIIQDDGNFRIPYGVVMVGNAMDSTSGMKGTTYGYVFSDYIFPPPGTPTGAYYVTVKAVINGGSWDDDTDGDGIGDGVGLDAVDPLHGDFTANYHPYIWFPTTWPMPSVNTVIARVYWDAPNGAWGIYQPRDWWGNIIVPRQCQTLTEYSPSKTTWWYEYGYELAPVDHD